jgi:hypothetical protein
MRLPALLLATVSLIGFPGCAGKPTARNWAGPPPPTGLFTPLEQQTCVLFLGPFQHRVVPWFDGLTLAQALVAARYLSPEDPRVIVLTRDGVPTEISAAALLAGEDLLVQPGDMVGVLP